MCAVCWSSVQLVPAAVVGARAFYAHRLNKGLDADPAAGSAEAAGEAVVAPLEAVEEPVEEPVEAVQAVQAPAERVPASV